MSMRILRPLGRNGPGMLVLLGVLSLYSALFISNRISGPGASDGFYSYLYARSLAFDHDIDFTNDYALCGDPWHVSRDRGTGHPDNQAYAGPALFWTPVVWLAAHVMRVPKEAPASTRGGCEGPIAVAAMSTTPLVAALAVWLSFLVARRLVSERIAFASALLFAVASSLPAYATLFVSFSHAYECVACALLLWLTARAREAGRVMAWLPVGLAVGLCALQRLSDGCLACIPLALIATESSRAWRWKTASGALVVAGGAVGVAITLLIYAYLYGTPWVVPQGRHFLHFGHAHPLLVLFAPHGGLLYATPVAYLGLGGLTLGIRQPTTRVFACAAAACFVLCLWISSSALDWNAKGTFGARRLVVMTPVLIVFGALALARLRAALDRYKGHLLAMAAIVMLGAPVIGGTLAMTRGEVPIESGAPQAVLYGNGVRALWSTADERLGDLTILPAELVYAGRFGVRMRSFRAATTDRYYRRSYETMSWDRREIDFRESVARDPSSGTLADPAGLRIADHDATVLFAAEWPFVTDLELEVDSARPSDLALSLGTFFRRCALGVRSVEPAINQSLHYSIPTHCFDSGIVELKFTTTGAGSIVLRRLTLNDSRSYPPPL